MKTDIKEVRRRALQRYQPMDDDTPRPYAGNLVLGFTEGWKACEENMTKKGIYVSLPITGYDLKERIEYANKVKKGLRLQFPAHEVITPFDIPGFVPDQTWEWYMARDLETLSRCRGIYLCEGWESSKGRRLEYEYAKFLGVQIIEH